MDDTIYRQAAIDAFNTSSKELVVCGIQDAIMVENYLNRVLEKIKGLPPAKTEIIYCKDCKHCEHWYADRGRCFFWHEDGFCNYAERRDGDDDTD